MEVLKLIRKLIKMATTSTMVRPQSLGHLADFMSRQIRKCAGIPSHPDQITGRYHE